MFKKLIQFFLGEPEGYVSEYDKFIAEHRGKLSSSQQKEIKQQQDIISKRD